MIVYRSQLKPKPIFVTGSSVPMVVIGGNVIWDTFKSIVAKVAPSLIKLASEALPSVATSLFDRLRGKDKPVLSKDVQRLVDEAVERRMINRVAID